MLIKKYILFNASLIIIVLSMIAFASSAQGIDEPIKLFKQQKFTEALPSFKTLIRETPNDPSLAYYTGVCLTETNQFGKETIELLLTAANGNQPFDVNYYLAKNYHALNDFKVARSYYTIFGQKASSKEKKSFDLKTKIDLCERSINPFPFSPQKPAIEQPSAPKTEEPATPIVEEIPVETPAALNDTLINFILTSEIYYTRFYQFRTGKGKQYFINGWNNSDSLIRLIHETDSLRSEYGKTLSSESKSKIADRVIDLENQIVVTKSASDESFFKASEWELSFWKLAPEDEKWKLLAENDSIKKAEETKRIPVITTVAEPSDTIIATDSTTTDSIAVVEVEPIAEPVKTNQILFKIQIGKYNTELPESTKKLFKKIAVLRKIDQYTDEKNFTVYTIGELTNLKDAVKLQDQIRQESVKDAFVIAIKDGKRIPLNEALELLKK